MAGQPETESESKIDPAYAALVHYLENSGSSARVFTPWESQFFEQYRSLFRPVSDLGGSEKSSKKSPAKRCRL